MGKMNEKMDAAETAKVMQEFAKQNEYMNVKEDMLDDALMDAVSGWRMLFFVNTHIHLHTNTYTQFDGDGVEEEADGVVSQVLEEIGIAQGHKMTEAPTSKLSAKEQEEVEDKEAMAALEKLLPTLAK